MLFSRQNDSSTSKLAVVNDAYMMASPRFVKDYTPIEKGSRAEIDVIVGVCALRGASVSSDPKTCIDLQTVVFWRFLRHVLIHLTES